VRSRSIEEMSRDDLDEVIAIERVSFSKPWSRNAFLHEMERNQVARCWVLREDAQVAGYLCTWQIVDELHVTNLAVHPDRRHQGLGRMLLGRILDEARHGGVRHVVLEVRPSNIEARGLYESFGFRVVGRRRGYYYDTGEDALVMEAALTGDDGNKGGI